MFAKRPITIALRTFSHSHSPSTRARSFQRCYSENYRIAGCKNVENSSAIPKSGEEASAAKAGDRRLEDNSHVKTRNHAYYEKYSIPGFHPLVNALPTQAGPSRKVSPGDVQKREAKFEDTRSITTCNHADDEGYSIARFKPHDAVPSPIKAVTSTSQGDEVDDEMDPYSYNHDYYKNYSIAGFKPMETPDPDSVHREPTKEPAGMSLDMSRAKDLAIAAAYVPSSISVWEQAKGKDLDVDRDVDLCAQTIESLEWEKLGIVGFREASHDQEEEEGENEYFEGEMDAEKGKSLEKDVQLEEGANGVVRAGSPAICFCMGLF
ncbi:hypothetical protein DSL72_001997 [Monilinia vaccinii-corymbosi]|uniref:Uncharacterized protein n=1 Tax=Monilinia vaccinii-corymbosi TaxID=61207 RepID=A0A8A3PBE8_9HELO|nr:hypothetical protein DSL72_001997 [Monilinia vaccinii-corymbosi]